MMGKKLNLSHLTDVECDQIMNVLQKDFEVRRLEKKRISEVHGELAKEQSRIAILKKNPKFNETSCIICLERFGLIFHRKRQCYRCSLHICSVCSQPRERKKKGFICQVCHKEKEYKMLSNQWFYNNTHVSDKTFGSSKVVKSLYKRTAPALSDTDLDSGYSPSSVSSAAPNKPPRSRLDNVFDISMTEDNADETSTEESNPVALVPKPRASVLNAARSQSEHCAVPVPRARKQKDNDAPDLYKEALDEARRAVEFKFRVDFYELIEDLHVHLEESERGGQSTSSASPSYGEMVLILKDRVKELLKGFNERLQLSYESFGSAQSPESTRQIVDQHMSKCLEDLFDGNIDLTSDEAISDLLSHSNDSSADESTFEDLVAQIVVSKLLENHSEEISTTFLSSKKNGTNETSPKEFSESENQSDYDKNNENNTDVDTFYSKGNIDIRLEGTKSNVGNISRVSNPGLSSYQRVLLSDDTDNERDKYFDKVNSYSGITKANIENNANSKAEYDDGRGAVDERNVINEESSLVSEFEELKDFVKKTSRRPKVKAVAFDDSGLYEVEEEAVMKTEVNQGELMEEFQARYSVFDRIHNSGPVLPDISHSDNMDIASAEIDPDLLSLNLEIIPEETEEELGQEMETKSENTNWTFKSTALLPKEKIGKRKDKMDPGGSMFMKVPSPKDIYAPRIGNSTIDQLRDLSDPEGSEDEEYAFYANTSKELARIAEQRNRLSHAYWLQPGYHSDDSDFYDRMGRQKPSLLRDQNSLDCTDTGSSMEHISRPLIEPCKQEIKLLQDLIPAENDNPKFVIAPESVTIQEGEPVKFSCRVAGTGNIDVFWYREGDEIEELEDSADVEITNDGDKHSIILYNISKKMGGQYICIAVNEQGKAIQYLVVTVKDSKQELKKPEFLKGLKDVEVTEGQSVKFRVKVKGYPPPRVSWYKDGQLLKTSKCCRIEKFGNRDYVLIIDHASMHDDAEYTVLARNVAGEQKLSAQVIVDPKSDLVVKKQSISTTTSGVSDSDSDMSMSYRSLILAANSSISLSPTTTATTTLTPSANSTTQHRESQLPNNSLDINTTLAQKKGMHEAKTTSEKLLTSEVVDVLRIAEDIIQQENHSFSQSSSQKLIKEDSVPSFDKNKNNKNASSTLFMTQELKPGLTEDLALQDILNDFCLPVCDTKFLAQNQSSFDLAMPGVHKHQQVLRDQYSRDFEMPQTAERKKCSESFSPQVKEIHRENTIERKDERGDSSSQCSSPRQSIDSGVYVSSQQEQVPDIHITRSANTNKFPDSQIQLDDSIELPSVDVLKAVFSSVEDDDDLGNGTLKRVHSITARNVPMEQLEKLRASNQNQSSSASSTNLLEAPVLSESLSESQQMNSNGSLSPPSKVILKPTSTSTHSATAQPQQQQAFQAAATEAFRNLDVYKDPVLIYSANEHTKRHDKQQNTVKPKPATRSSKTSLLLHPSQQQAAKQIQVSTNTVKQLATPPQPQTSGLVTANVVSHGKIDSTHKNGPRIKTGCISARTAFWERKLADGGAVNDDEFPNMVESSDV